MQDTVSRPLTKRNMITTDTTGPAVCSAAGPICLSLHDLSPSPRFVSVSAICLQPLVPPVCVTGQTAEPLVNRRRVTPRTGGDKSRRQGGDGHSRRAGFCQWAEESRQTRCPESVSKMKDGLSRRLRSVLNPCRRYRVVRAIPCHAVSVLPAPCRSELAAAIAVRQPCQAI